MTLHLASIDIKRLVEKYPNDQELGSKLREMYIQDIDKTYRQLLDLPRATVNNSKSTSVTTVENQLELPF
mgnify:FL=1|jgi:hypothetical protein